MSELIAYHSREAGALEPGEVVLWRGRPGRVWRPSRRRERVGGWTGRVMGGAVVATVVAAALVATAEGRGGWLRLAVLGGVTMGFVLAVVAAWVTGAAQELGRRWRRAGRERHRRNTPKYFITDRRVIAVRVIEQPRRTELRTRHLAQTRLSTGEDGGRGDLSCSAGLHRTGSVRFERIRGSPTVARLLRRLGHEAAGGRRRRRRRPGVSEGIVDVVTTTTATTAADDVPAAVRRELDDGERLLWTGRPGPRRWDRRARLRYVGSWLWQVIPVVMLVASGSWWERGGGRALNALPALTGGIACLWLLVGVWSLTVGRVQEARQLARTLYAATDRRLIVITCKPRDRGVESQSLLVHAIERLTLDEEVDGSGDVGCGMISFRRVPDARGVYTLVLRLGQSAGAELAGDEPAGGG